MKKSGLQEERKIIIFIGENEYFSLGVDKFYKGLNKKKYMAEANFFITQLAILALTVIFLTLALKTLKMPSVVAYILAGVLLGAHGLGVINNDQFVSQLGSIGVLLLLFFIGMEVSIQRIIANWRIAIIGTLLKVIVTLGLTFIIGYFTGWPLARVVLLAFVLSLSSTAVVLKILADRNENETKVGSDVISVLLVQDVIVIPMIVIMGFFSKDGTQFSSIILQIIGAVLFIGLLWWIIKKGTINFPFSNVIHKDHDIQFFVALLFCFGFATFTSFFELSPTLGAFFAGILISAGRETSWVKESLHPFYILFMALFFMSIGLLMDLDFFIENIMLIVGLTLFVFLINTLMFTFIFKALKDSWKESLYAAALLSQVGEFGFILADIGLKNNIIVDYGYSIVISVISLSLLLSPLWIIIIKKAIDFDSIKLKKLKFKKRKLDNFES